MTTHTPSPRRRGQRRDDAGFTLIETMFALGLLLIVAAGMLPMGLLATKTAENQGHLVARTTEYAQDKLEQLLSLAYGDSTSDTRQFPSPDTGGSGLTLGGSSNPDTPVALYSDYLDIDGNLLDAANGPPADWFYKRVWQVSSPKANLKQIAVSVTVRVSALGGIGEPPVSNVTALKTSPF